MFVKLFQPCAIDLKHVFYNVITNTRELAKFCQYSVMPTCYTNQSIHEDLTEFKLEVINNKVNTIDESDLSSLIFGSINMQDFDTHQTDDYYDQAISIIDQLK